MGTSQPPSYEEKPPTVGQILYHLPPAPTAPPDMQQYDRDSTMSPVLSPRRPEDVGQVTTMIEPTRHVVAATHRPPSTLGSVMLRVVMFCILLTAIPAGAACIYTGSIDRSEKLRYFGIALQVVGFLVVELLQMVWYFKAKYAFLRANVTVVH